MRSHLKALGIFLAASGALLLLHQPLLQLPYFWDEAGYYVPSALDFCRSWTLIPHTTLPEGHPPLVMVYLGLAWRLFGYAPLVARAAMTLIGAGTVTALYVLARRIANAEIAAWSSFLLALSPLFFAQTTLVHLDLVVALFTTLAVLFLLEKRVLVVCADGIARCLEQGNGSNPSPRCLALRLAEPANAQWSKLKHGEILGRTSCSRNTSGCVDNLLPSRNGLLDREPGLSELQRLLHPLPNASRLEFRTPPL